MSLLSLVRIEPLLCLAGCIHACHIEPSDLEDVHSLPECMSIPGELYMIIAHVNPPQSPPEMPPPGPAQPEIEPIPGNYPESPIPSSDPEIPSPGSAPEIAPGQDESVASAAL